MNPLICIPSVRDIIEVKRLWHQLPYDKFIVKYKLHYQSYKDIKDFFFEHTEYDVMVIQADDLEVQVHHLERLLETLQKYNLETVSGYCNIDESQPDTYTLQPLGVDFTREICTTFGSYYMKDKKPILPMGEELLQVGHSGFPCQVITRELFNKITITGENDEIRSNFDFQFAKECHKLGVPLMVDLSVKMWHRRFEQYDRVKAWKENLKQQDMGYTVFIEGR